MWNLDKRLTACLLVILIIVFCLGVKYENIKNERQGQEDLVDVNLSGDVIDLSQPAVSEQNQEIQVYVAGQVNNPGVYKLAEGARVYEAVSMAGGTLDDADLIAISMARELVDGETIFVPLIGEVPPAGNIITTNNANIANPSSNSARLNINTAAASEMADRLNGIGLVLAQRIVEYRTTNGPFKTIEDIKNVSGIGDKKFEGIKNDICVR
ncbi:MAG: ComEA family DNA-binding protein [Syntrophomonadaceae bacterium]|nr:ComEA family DNA-binding protein [Syntrophomonadaceae bacterium]MDD4550150.1 ComEA family DNA-binding protein [Syntrophomonadaceae bacterium]